MLEQKGRPYSLDTRANVLKWYLPICQIILDPRKQSNVPVSKTYLKILK